jgi:hypothetical protein
MNDVVKPSLAVGGKITPIIPQDFDACWRLGSAISSAGMGPRGMSAEQITIAIVQGLEVGLTPMAAVQSIAVVNNRPTIWGDGAIALVRASGKLESISEAVAGEGDKMVATCSVKRKGEEEAVRTFSAAEAKTAGLWDKDIWKKYPKRMLAMRARAYALRDVFADVLKGLAITEEVQDYDIKDVTPPKPPAPPKPTQEAQDEQEAPEKAKTPPKPEAAPESRPEVEDAIVEDVSDEKADEAPDDDSFDSIKYFEDLEERMGNAETLEDLEEIWTEADPMAVFEGNAVDQGIAMSIKRRYTRRLGG